MHYVTLADGRKIGLGKYVAAWKACREIPANTPIGKGVSGWGQTAGEALADLRRGIEDRINRHIPGYGVGRKWLGLAIWVDFKNEADREFEGGSRFIVQEIDPEGCPTNEEPALETDEWSEVESFVSTHHKINEKI